MNKQVFPSRCLGIKFARELELIVLSMTKINWESIFIVKDIYDNLFLHF